MVEVMKKVSGKYEENVKAARKIFPKALVFDVTLEGSMKRLDPGFPIGKVDVPGRKIKGLSVNGVWEGLKEFRTMKRDKESGEMKEVVKEIDIEWMNDERKLGKVRGCKCWGELIGIRVGAELVDVEKGSEIFKEVYERLMKERFGRVLEGIRREARKRTVVLLDYMEERKRPFNHVEVLREMLVA